MGAVNTRWQRTDAPRGADYDARWSSLAASGQNIHGEADLVEMLLTESGGRTVLDAGCGNGRDVLCLRGIEPPSALRRSIMYWYCGLSAPGW